MSQKKSKLQKLAVIFDKNVKRDSEASSTPVSDTEDVLDNVGDVKDTEDLIDSYIAEYGAIGGGDLNTLQLRSGHSYPTAPTSRRSPSYLDPLPPPPPPSELGTLVNTEHTEPPVTQTMAATSIKVIPTHMSISNDTDQ